MAVSAQSLFDALEAIAPLRLAESWDNVGLLIEPLHATHPIDGATPTAAEFAAADRAAAGQRHFETAFLTVDLTAQTLAEAVKHQADFIVAYHPPIFSGLKRLQARQPRDRVVLEVIQRGLTVYSPHTALDAVAGGMNDWLASCLGPGTVVPIKPCEGDGAAGAGRKVQLEAPVSGDEAVQRIKRHLGLRHVRVARPLQDEGRELRTLAVCPGAGGSLFAGLGDVDILLTGEMRHHDVLDRVARGSWVVLTDHTNTERGYLPTLAADLRARCPGLSVVVSESDRDPLAVD